MTPRAASGPSQTQDPNGPTRKPAKVAKRLRKRTRNEGGREALAGASSPLTGALERNTPYGDQPERRLSTAHRRQLEDESAISPDVIDQRGYFTATDASELAELGFHQRQRTVPALVIPIHDVQGSIAGHQVRPDSPRARNDKLLKYEFPAGSRVVIDVPPSVRPTIGNPDRDLWLTEGSKKVDAAVSQGLNCIALSGVWNWRGKNDDGGMTALACWEHIALKGRRVIVAFDSDVTEKTEVQTAMARLRAFLHGRGATTLICLLPQTNTGGKTGLDDYFARGGTTAELEAFLVDELPDDMAVQELAGEYVIKNDGVYLESANRDGDRVVRKQTNFVARIEEEVRFDDGAETRTEFVIKAQIPGEERIARVAAEEFRKLDWIHGQLGATARVEVGVTTHRLCHMVQKLSDPKKTTVYGHTGWRLIDGGWYFLHAGGAIGGPGGPHGPLSGTRVTLPEGLSRVRLPTVPPQDVLAIAVQEALTFLQVAPRPISWPLLLAPFVAALRDPGFSYFLLGITGTRKSSTAAVVQQFYGHDFSVQRPLANWSSTANANEELQFTAKDMMTVIDDFVVPAGGDRGRLDSNADRVLRNQANRSGRARLRPDGSTRPLRPPRSLVLSTGESLPRGSSLLARNIVLELQRDSIDLERLATLQELGDNGVLSQAFAGFLSWLAPQLDELCRLKPGARTHYRKLVGDLTPHGRTSEALADLLYVREIVVRFAQDCGAIRDEQATAMLDDSGQALIEMARQQSGHQAVEDIAANFMSLLGSALASGAAHVSSTADSSVPPKNLEEVAGWRHNSSDASPPSSVTHWRPMGKHIGFADETSLSLIPEVAESVCQTLAREQTLPLTLGGIALQKRLHEAGLLLTHDLKDGGRLTVRKQVGGSRRRVLHITWSSLSYSGLGHVGHLGQELETTSNAAASLPPYLPDRQAPTDQHRPCTPCFTCKGSEFYQHPLGRWICCRCHPPTRAGQGGQQ